MKFHELVELVFFLPFLSFNPILVSIYPQNQPIMDSWIIAFDFILKVHSVLNKLVCRCFLKCIPKLNSNIRYGCMSILNEDSLGSMKASSIESCLIDILQKQDMVEIVLTFRGCTVMTHC